MTFVESLEFHSKREKGDVMDAEMELLREGETVWSKKVDLNPGNYPDAWPGPDRHRAQFSPGVHADTLKLGFYDLEAATPLTVFLNGEKLDVFEEWGSEAWQRRSYDIRGFFEKPVNVVATGIGVAAVGAVITKALNWW